MLAPSATRFVHATTSCFHLNVARPPAPASVSGFASAPVMPMSGTFCT